MRRPLHIEYHRPPDRVFTYEQDLILDRPDVKVSLQLSTPIDRPLVVDGRTILEPGAAVVWFTFPDMWHDIGRFHRADGTFTGLYANILTPVELPASSTPADEPVRWRTTDLFLDLWLPEDVDPDATSVAEAPGAGATPVLLDEEEWERACRLGHLSRGVGERARTEADTLRARARQRRWPPPIVHEWTLGKALAEIDR